MTDDLTEIQARQAEFVAERDWEEYHRPKNLAMAISVEASELVELYQWRESELSAACRENEELREATREELADILCYTLSLADQLNIDLGTATVEKIEANSERYPADDPPSPME
ncbi:nucleotide pyrophosphohydrolase [Halobaculum lipolyticum]|uniref:Nucleotide pyrophosphohydrolase n=1 Tax=Halobaculum lipolyticum TaxID=3032001 RepID=A0ABD5WBD6_9EURY